MTTHPPKGRFSVSAGESFFPSLIRMGEAGEREPLLGAWRCTGSYLKAEFTGVKTPWGGLLSLLLLLRRTSFKN